MDPGAWNPGCRDLNLHACWSSFAHCRLLQPVGATGRPLLVVSSVQGPILQFAGCLREPNPVAVEAEMTQEVLHLPLHWLGHQKQHETKGPVGGAAVLVLDSCWNCLHQPNLAAGWT